MPAPPWGHKPPAVDNPERYWIDPPPVMSERCAYWLRRYREGTWRPNKYLAAEGYHSRAEKLGVYIWESVHVFAPLLEEHFSPAGR